MILMYQSEMKLKVTLVSHPYATQYKTKQPLEIVEFMPLNVKGPPC